MYLTLSHCHSQAVKMDNFKANLRTFVCSVSVCAWRCCCSLIGAAHATIYYLDDFGGGFNSDGVSDLQRLNDRLQINLKYYWANYVLMMVVTLALSVFLVWFYMLGPCFCGLAIIAHAALRKESVHGVGTVKTNELKNRAKDMIANAKARQKSG